MAGTPGRGRPGRFFFSPCFSVFFFYFHKFSVFFLFFFSIFTNFLFFFLFFCFFSGGNFEFSKFKIKRVGGYSGGAGAGRRVRVGGCGLAGTGRRVGRVL